VFDSEYFRTILQADVNAMGGNAIVDLHLLNGLTHRLHSVVSVHSGYVTLVSFQNRGEDALVSTPRWQEERGEGKSPHETLRAVVAYESIASITVTPTRATSAPRIGFGGL
jgi:hypothetical protein